MNELLQAVAGPLCALLAVMFTVAGRRRKGAEAIAADIATAVAEVSRNPLIGRRLERLASAYRSQDKADILRRQSELMRAGVNPPDTLEECERRLAAGEY